MPVWPSTAEKYFSICTCYVAPNAGAWIETHWPICSNPNFKPVEFDGFKAQAGLNNFYGLKEWWL